MVPWTNESLTPLHYEDSSGSLYSDTRSPVFLEVTHFVSFILFHIPFSGVFPTVLFSSLRYQSTG